MSCRAVTKSGSICNNSVNKYGVCRKHKQWAFKGPSNLSDPLYTKIQRYVQTQVDLMRRNSEACERYVSRGNAPLTIQGPWRGNLCRVLTLEEIQAIEDPDVREFALTSEQCRANIEKAKEYMDPYLACNLATGANDYINDRHTQVPLRVLCIQGVCDYLN